jgi:hypothetical protein
MKNKLFAGVLAGMVATVVLSLLMVMKGMMGVMPGLDVVKMLAAMMGAGLAVGWAAHFMIGIGYGIIFSWTENLLPGNATVKGMILGTLAWLMMMVAVMPMAGAGMFGLNMGVMAPVATLILHLIFGAVLGFTYQKLSK